MLFDEATSALDSKSEEFVVKSIKDAISNKTSV
jgi:ABC-type bacteriocin/lantibiotic exporter with double-glycine peptidase domain